MGVVDPEILQKLHFTEILLLIHATVENGVKQLCCALFEMRTLCQYCVVDCCVISSEKRLKALEHRACLTRISRTYYPLLH